MEKKLCFYFLQWYKVLFAQQAQKTLSFCNISARVAHIGNPWSPDPPVRKLIALLKQKIPPGI